MLSALRKPGFSVRISPLRGAISSRRGLDARCLAGRASDSRCPIPHSRAPQQRRAGGFSLIELVAVMVLIALVFAMVSLSFSKSLSSAKVQAASRNLVAALRYTRGQAIVRGKSTSLELDV